VSLDRHIESLKFFYTGEAVEGAAADPRLNDAIKEAFLRCHPDKRFLLAAYFFDNRTLAEIAAMLGVHESTVSRRMNRTLRELRNGIARGLRKRGMTMRQAQESLQSDVRTLSLDLRRHLLPGINMVGE
jgi:RNA polymerase sigma-70 factor (ECF subfamily)